ncbi:hypothetical protein HYFRA_00007135 [Hymenoscyphus fraxineus]|uniref:Uncharacterized protein n=1 Tax=Hymenoscyphus fraxineus TaxID=746836 RepID=A0A9N9KVK9_9HELO|nr:hypothetical protein HYFRA_00007135 [Hymenoscyphus fraxineus]
MTSANTNTDRREGTGFLNSEATGRLVLSYRGKQKYTRHVETRRRGSTYQPTAVKEGAIDIEDKHIHDGLDHGLLEGYEECKASACSAYPYGHNLPGEHLDIPSDLGMIQDESASYQQYREGFNKGFKLGWKKAAGEKTIEWEKEDGGWRDGCPGDGCVNFSYNGHPRFRRHEFLESSPSVQAKAFCDIEADASIDFCDGFDHGIKEGRLASKKPSGRPSDHLAIPRKLKEYCEGFDIGFMFGFERKYGLVEAK